MQTIDQPRYHSDEGTETLQDSAPKRGTLRTLAIILFAIYALVLVGMVLFKFPFQYTLNTNGRDLNLIPFAGAFVKGQIGVGEVLANVLVFVPLGLYVSMLRTRWSYGLRVLAVVATSVAFETIQFAFAIGRADVTDVITNVLGGAVGIALYAVAAKLLKRRTNRVLTIVAFVLTILFLAFFTFLRLHSK